MKDIPNTKQNVENVYQLLANFTNYVCPWECSGVVITSLSPTIICQHMKTYNMFLIPVLTPTNTIV